MLIPESQVETHEESIRTPFSTQRTPHLGLRRAQAEDDPALSIPIVFDHA